MKNRKDYRKKPEVITTPHHVPVAVYIQEADALYHWLQGDKEALTAVGLSWELVQELPSRCRALIEAEARWQACRRSRDEGSRQWDRRSRPAYDLRDRLLGAFRFAFRSHPDLTAAVRAISQGNSRPAMIQALSDLAVLGEANRELLEAIRFDISLLEKAAQTAAEMASLLAKTTGPGKELRDAKKARDLAYTCLKEAVNEIRLAGRYAFRKNRERSIGYTSSHIRRVKRRQRQKAKQEQKPDDQPVVEN